MKKRGKWWRRLLILLLVLGLSFLAVRVYKGFAVRMLLTRTWDQEHQVCNVHMEKPSQLEGISVSWDDMEQQRYFTVDTGTEQLYLHNRNLFFSNGTGYDVAGLLDALNIPEELFRYFPFLISPERGFDGGYDTWEFQLPEEPGWLIEKMIPEALPYWEQVQPLRFILYEEAGWLRYILICDEDLYNHDSIYIYLELLNEEPKPIPTELLMQMGTKPLPDVRTLEPLLRAGQELNKPGTTLADMSIRVDCGPLPIQDTGKIRFSEEGLYISRGNEWTELTPESVRREDLLLGLGWSLVRDGVWEPDGTASGVFSLTIPSEELKSSLLSIIPELEGMDFTLDDGKLTITIADNRLIGMELIGSGQIPFLITTIPLSIQLELTVTG